ncbi:MAG TPA: hypothetical protein VKP78_06305 [bacterium]|nr:hypothetical protein [bacterium]
MKFLSNRSKILFLILLTLGLAVTGFAQYGKNKVTYDDFDWQYLKTRHFDVFYYKGGRKLAEFAAPIAEDQIDRLSKLFGWNMSTRVPLLIYNSHRDFQQTNVVQSYMGEGVQGVTELFKNRAVVAFDGDYHAFWHVLRHELLHVYINEYIYGGSIQNVISGKIRTQVPLWMNEGIAEYSSMKWDTRADMIMRDLVISSQIPDLSQLRYYLVYKGGQSFYRFIVDKYGVEKIGELWKNLKAHHRVDKTFQVTFGKKVEEISNDWHKWLKREYWQDLQDREEIEEFATRLTDHMELKNSYNTAPAISPNGKKVALISDRDDYMDIYLISALDGKVIKKVLRGQNKPALEEMKILRPKLDWSPDGKKLVIATKSGGSDALIFIDINTEEFKRVPIKQVNEIYSASWSPDGKKIAFSGLYEGQTDLYCYMIESDSLVRLTNDQYSDFGPSWSPNSQQIVFASARNPNKIDEANLPATANIDHRTDLYIYDIKSDEIKELFVSNWNSSDPVWPKTGHHIFFTSDSNGVSNIYSLNMYNGDVKALTNALTGCYYPESSSNGKKIAFAGYANRGWDVYTINNPLERSAQIDTIKPTKFALENKNLWRNNDKIDQMTALEDEKKYSGSGGASQAYSSYIFRPKSFISTEDTTQQEEELVEKTDEKSDSTEAGEYPTRDYKTKFTLDFVSSQAGYSTYWGFQGTNVFVFSDILGNHRITLGTEMYLDLKDSDYYLTYQYLQQRWDYYFTGFHMANFYGYGGQMYRWRNYGFDLITAYPFSKFSRLETGLMWYNVQQSWVNLTTGQSEKLNTLNTIMPRAALVYDNSMWGYLSPINGWRARLDMVVSPKYNQNALEFTKLKADVRKYVKLNRNYSFAFRLSSGISLGADRQNYFLGGMNSWLNYKFKRDYDLSNPEELYYSEIITPLRGARYYERQGNKFFLGNIEFRYPFIEYLKLGWPLPMLLGGIQGCTFMDFGTAWSDDLKLIGHNDERGLYMDDLVSGVGFGARIYLGYFLLRIDTAWRYDMDSFSKPKYYISLGLDY